MQALPDREGPDGLVAAAYHDDVPVLYRRGAARRALVGCHGPEHHQARRRQAGERLGGRAYRGRGCLGPQAGGVAVEPVVVDQRAGVPG